MTAIWVASLGGMLLLCLGALVGTSWADQAFGHRYQRLALERRELNERRRALQETCPHCAWCGTSTALAGDASEVGGRVNVVTYGDPSPPGATRAVGERR